MKSAAMHLDATMSPTSETFLLDSRLSGACMIR
jgi:hypothetical protein